MSTVRMAFKGLSRNVCIMAGIFSLHDLYLTGKAPLLVGDMLVNVWDILPEGSACWDSSANSHLTWLSSDSLYMP